jgi:alkylated DNA repair dioxygenase AlkB
VRQLSLLALPELPVPNVPGLAYVADYVTKDEERELLAAIDRQPWRMEWERRRQIYGLSYGSARGEARVLGPLPSWLVPLAERVVRHGWLEGPVANVVINEYLPGQGIGSHHDYPGFGPTVVAVSLGSPCLLDLVEPDSGRKEVLDVAERSLWILGGEARTKWKHGIAHRRTDVIAGIKRPRGRRVSVTMRTGVDGVQLAGRSPRRSTESTK